MEQIRDAGGPSRWGALFGNQLPKLLGWLADRMARSMIRFDLPPKSTHLLTVAGRRSGLPRSTPLSVVRDGDTRWLVSMYGESAWVKNVRAAGRVTLSRGKWRREYQVTELPPARRAPVLRSYLQIEPLGRRRIGLGPNSPDEDLLSIAPKVPVFRADPVPPDDGSLQAGVRNSG